MSQIKTGAILAYLNVAVSNVSALVYTPILVRALGQSVFGVYKMSDSVMASLSLLSFGFGTAYIRFHSQLKVKNDQQGIARLNGMYILLFSGMGLVAGVAGGSISVFSNEIFGFGLSSDEIQLAKLLMTIMTINIALTFPSSVFNSYLLVNEKFTWIYARSLILKLAGPIVGTALLFLGFGAVGATLATLLSTILGLIWNAIYACRKLDMKFRIFPLHGPLFREIGVFSFWIFLSQLFSMLTDNTTSFIVASRAGAIDVAVFSVAFQMQLLFISLSTALSGLFVPRINTLVASSASNDKLLDLMSQVGRYQLILHCALLGAFAILGRFFLLIWVGEGYNLSFWLTIIMAVSVTAPLAQNTGIQIQQAKNMHQFRSIVYLISALMGAILCWLLAPWMGALSGALGYALTMFSGTWIAMNWYYHNRVGLHMGRFWKQMFPIFLTFSVSTGVSLMLSIFVLPITSLLNWIVMGSFYVIMNCVALWIFVLRRSEKHQIRSLIKRSSK